MIFIGAGLRPAPRTNEVTVTFKVTVTFRISMARDEDVIVHGRGVFVQLDCVLIGVVL